MNQEWISFLQFAGAEFGENNIVKHFGAPTREAGLVNSGTIFSPLTGLTVIRISGRDCAEFLQNQLSNDITLLKNHKSQTSAWCNHQGRIIAIFNIFKTGDEFILILPVNLVETVISKLKLFILRSQVNIVHDTDLVLIGTVGIEEDFTREIDHEGILYDRIPGVLTRYMLAAPIERAKGVWAKLDVHNAAAGNNAWKLAAVRAGLAEIDKDTSEKFVPQVLNLDTLNVVNFNKGCYPGQEVVARMEYLGKAKKRLFHISMHTGQNHDKTLIGKQDFGTVVMHAQNSENSTEALAVLERLAVEQGGIESKRLKIINGFT